MVTQIKLSCKRTYVVCTAILIAFQTILQASGVLGEEFGLDLILQVVQPYMSFADHVCLFKIMTKRMHGFEPIEQKKSLAGGWTASTGLGRVSDVAWGQSVAEDEACRLITYIVLDHVSEAMYKSWFYMTKKSWPRLERFATQCFKLLKVFENIPDSLKRKVGISKSSRPSMTVMELNEEGQVVSENYTSETPFSTLFKNPEIVYGVPPFCWYDSGRLNNDKPRSRLSSMLTAQGTNKPQRLMVNKAF